jgi:hypothetical protein
MRAPAKKGFFAMPGTIETYRPFTNQSGIAHDIPKIQAAGVPPPWREVDGFKEHYRDGRMVVERVYSVPWSIRSAFMEYMLGFSQSKQSVVIGGGGNAAPSFFISRVIPAQDPERPFLYCRDVELLKGNGAWVPNPNTFAQNADGSTFFDANNHPVLIDCLQYQDTSTNGDGIGFYKATFMDVDFEIRSDANPPKNPNVPVELGRWVSRKYTYASQNIPLANLLVQFADDGTLIPEAGPGLIITGQDCIFEWHEVPDVPEAAITACVGHINLQAFDGLGGYPQFPAGTLLCMAPAKQRYRTRVGRVAWEIKYHFLYKSQGWNFFPDATGKFRLGQYKGGAPIFPSADFNTLFEVPAPATYQ